MRLCHRTDQKGREGIEAKNGFWQPDPPVGPELGTPDRGRVWFAISQEVARETTCGRSGWWVWIEVPDDTPQHQLDNGETYAGVYGLPIDFVNGLEMTFEQGD